MQVYHYILEQKRSRKVLREHTYSWSTVKIIMMTIVPVSIVYTWKQQLTKKGSSNSIPIEHPYQDSDPNIVYEMLVYGEQG